MLAQALQAITASQLIRDTVSYAEALSALVWLHNYICAALPSCKSNSLEAAENNRASVSKALASNRDEAAVVVLVQLQQAATATKQHRSIILISDRCGTRAPP